MSDNPKYEIGAMVFLDIAVTITARRWIEAGPHKNSDGYWEYDVNPADSDRFRGVEEWDLESGD